MTHLDESDDFSEILSGKDGGSNDQGDWTYRVSAEGYREPTNFNFDEIPQGGRQRVNFHGVFTETPGINDPCYTAEGDGYEFRIEYLEDDYDILWEAPTPRPSHSPSEITVGLAPPLPWWFTAGAGVSVSLAASSYDKQNYHYYHWDVDSYELPRDQDTLATAYISLSHNGASLQSKYFIAWGTAQWVYWDNCPIYHTNIAFSESQKTGAGFDMDIVEP